MTQIYRILSNDVQNDTVTKFYKIVAISCLLNGSDEWALRRNKEPRIHAVEMEFLRRTAAHTRRNRKRTIE